MSFASPWWLLGGLIVPLAVIAHQLRRGRPQRYVVRHPAAASAREAAGNAPRWPRHVPAALMLVAVVLLVLALARPRVTHRVGIDHASLELVVDHSGSMAAQDVPPTRLVAAIRAANRFIDEVPADVRVGAVGFAASTDAVQDPTLNHGAARRLIDGLKPGGGTDTGGALTLALALLDGADRHHPPSAIVLVSDGAANTGPNPLVVSHTAGREHIPIDTVALGTTGGVLNPPGGFRAAQAVPPDPRLMREIAQRSDAREYAARSAPGLSAVLQRLGADLSTAPRHRDVTVWFVVGAAALLFAGAGASLGLGVRVP